jgi:hypothetical protein
MDLIELDTLRAETMRALLNEQGRKEVWKYDVVRSREALAEAVDRQSYDNMQTGVDALQAGKRYALVGPGIEDHHFTTPDDLVRLVECLCCDGHLSCYRSNVRPEVAGDAEVQS